MGHSCRLHIHLRGKRERSSRAKLRANELKVSQWNLVVTRRFLTTRAGMLWDSLLGKEKGPRNLCWFNTEPGCLCESLPSPQPFVFPLLARLEVGELSAASLSLPATLGPCGGSHLPRLAPGGGSVSAGVRVPSGSVHGEQERGGFLAKSLSCQLALSSPLPSLLLPAPSNGLGHWIMKEGGNLRGIEESRLKRWKRTARVIESLSIPWGGGFCTVLGAAGMDGWMGQGWLSQCSWTGRNLFGCNTPKSRDSPPAATINFAIGTPQLYICAPPNSLSTSSSRSGIAPLFKGWSCSFQSRRPSRQQRRLKSWTCLWKRSEMLFEESAEFFIADSQLHFPANLAFLRMQSETGTYVRWTCHPSHRLLPPPGKYFLQVSSLKKAKNQTSFSPWIFQTLSGLFLTG